MGENSLANGRSIIKRKSTSMESRASTKTREASLERTGSIKINKSLVDNKSGYTVEIRSRSKSGSRPGSRAGSRDRWVNSRWTDNEDNIEKGKEGGIHVTRGEKSFNCKSQKLVFAIELKRITMIFYFQYY